MGKIPPCKDCERKGCGSYHDQCKKYQEFVQERKVIRADRLMNAQNFKPNDYVKK